MNKKHVACINILIFVFLCGLLLNTRNISIAPNLELINTATFLSSLYAIGVTCLVIFISICLGYKVISPFKLSSLTHVERTGISLILGLAIIGYCEFFMGLSGNLEVIHHIFLLIILTSFSIDKSGVFISDTVLCLSEFKKKWGEFRLPMKIMASLGLVIILCAFIITLTPPFDYDGLMYHLEGPRIFLREGKIVPLDDNWLTFYPFIWEMVYLLGMGLGSDVFAKLVHFSSYLVLISITYSFGKRFISVTGGWLSSAILVGIPMVAIWATLAYIDVLWATVQFIAIGSLLIWRQERSNRYLLVAGIMQGLALSSKYFALSTAIILILTIIWMILDDSRIKQKIRILLISTSIFIFPAVLLSLPWYLKNLFWTGNPVFPFYLPQTIIDPVEFGLIMDYIKSFGTGQEWYKFLLLPFNLFIQNYKFGTFMGVWDYPSPLFLLVLIYPIIRSKIGEQNRFACDLLTSICCLQFIAWSLGMQQTRFLLPIYPVLCIVTSAIILSLPNLIKRIRLDRIFIYGVVGGTLLGSTIVMIGLHSTIKPFKVVLGQESKSDFLLSTLNDFSGINYILSFIPENSLVFMPWDGRGYYCDNRCYPDISQASWTSLIKNDMDLFEITDWFQEKGITHILYSTTEAYFFIYLHDQNNDHQIALNYLMDEYVPTCTEEIFSDNSIRLFEINSFCRSKSTSVD